MIKKFHTELTMSHVSLACPLSLSPYGFPTWDALQQFSSPPSWLGSATNYFRKVSLTFLSSPF